MCVCTKHMIDRMPGDRATRETAILGGYGTYGFACSSTRGTFACFGTSGSVKSRRLPFSSSGVFVAFFLLGRTQMQGQISHLTILHICFAENYL